MMWKIFQQKTAKKKSIKMHPSEGNLMEVNINEMGKWTVVIGAQRALNCTAKSTSKHSHSSQTLIGNGTFDVCTIHH